MLLFKQPIKNLQTGAALVEFAFVVPLLLLLVVGISEFSFAFYHFNILNKSVQDGARYFADPARARKGNIDMPIDTSRAGNGTNINSTENLVKYGNTAPGTAISQLLPGTAPVPTVYCAEENTSTLCAPTTQHIRVTAVYQHNLMTGDTLSGLMKLVGGGNVAVGSGISLTASSVLRVE